jgi:hypothetical protein
VRAEDLGEALDPAARRHAVECAGIGVTRSAGVRTGASQRSVSSSSRRTTVSEQPDMSSDVTKPTSERADVDAARVEQACTSDMTLSSTVRRAQAVDDEQDGLPPAAPAPADRPISASAARGRPVLTPATPRSPWMPTPSSISSAPRSKDGRD